MPKVLKLVSVTLQEDGSIPLLFGLDITDRGKQIHRTPLRRVIAPDGNVNDNLDDMSAYTEAAGYGPLTDRMRRLVYAIDAICRDDSEIEANRQSWIKNRPPMPEPPPPEPEES